MAEELDFSNPEHAAGSTIAAFGLAQMCFSTLVTNELISKSEAEQMLKQLIKAILARNSPIVGSPKRHRQAFRACAFC